MTEHIRETEDITFAADRNCSLCHLAWLSISYRRERERRLLAEHISGLDYLKRCDEIASEVERMAAACGFAIAAGQAYVCEGHRRVVAYFAKEWTRTQFPGPDAQPKEGNAS